jgi:hypothetical protein
MVHDVQRFLGLVQYISQYIPDLSAYTTPISALTKKSQEFVWQPIHDRCFEMIKEIACRCLVLHPINPTSGKPIWVITDARVSGVGVYYGQGDNWRTVYPAGFHSRKFTLAQMNYHTTEQELLVIIEALMKWEDQLLSQKCLDAHCESWVS